MVASKPLATKCLTMLENISSMIHLQQLQAQMTKHSLDQNPLALSKLISFSAISPHGDITYSSSHLTHINHPTTFMWNAIIRGFSQSPNPQNAFIYYSKMSISPSSPDNFTFPSLFKSCSRLFDSRMGSQFHSQVIKFGLLADSYLGSSLVYMYTTCGKLTLARVVFEEIQSTSIVVWNVMISGCVRSGVFVKEGIEYFHQMRVLCAEPVDEFSLVSVISACANLALFILGKTVHTLVLKTGFCKVVPLGNALVDMYGKCGKLNHARKVFDEMSVRDIVSWSTMIGVFAMHGRGSAAIELFREMESVGVAPDEGAFTSLLCACNHAGLLHEGKMWFENMSKGYGIEPKVQHYGCMVDLLGKAGMSREAYEFIREMPIEADAATWRSLVGACLYHGDLGLARIAARELMSFDVDDEGDAVIMSNVFSGLRRWDEVEKMRRGTVKSPGCSSIDVNNVVHEFFSRNNFHPQMDEICLVVNQITGQINY